VLDELCNDENHVSGIRHHVEQIQGFSFERLVLIFQTVDDDHLMLGSILGIHSNNARESSDTQISQIVIVARQKSGHTVCSSVEQARVGVNHRNRANALVTENDLSKTKKKKKKTRKTISHDSISRIDSRICALHAVKQRRVPEYCKKNQEQGEKQYMCSLDFRSFAPKAAKILF
jgi:hypothetical protein